MTIAVHCDAMTYHRLLAPFAELWGEAADMRDDDPQYPGWYAECMQGVYEEYRSPGSHQRWIESYYNTTK